MVGHGAESGNGANDMDGISAITRFSITRFSITRFSIDIPIIIGL